MRTINTEETRYLAKVSGGAGGFLVTFGFLADQPLHDDTVR
jgi:hypothetical protein